MKGYILCKIFYWYLWTIDDQNTDDTTFLYRESLKQISQGCGDILYDILSKILFLMTVNLVINSEQVMASNYRFLSVG
jgi:hypothetical protein